MALLPPAVLAFAWTCQKHAHVAGPVVALFISGFAVLYVLFPLNTTRADYLSRFIYSSTLAYIVDANPGRSTAAVASNSSLRGISSFIASEIAAPLQNAMGDGGLYSMWAGILLIMEGMLFLVIWNGKHWREEAEREERSHGWTKDHLGPTIDAESPPNNLSPEKR